jgi:hypothetical protein
MKDEGYSGEALDRYITGNYGRDRERLYTEDKDEDEDEEWTGKGF